jgi:predicted Zn-dependent protease
MGPATVELLRAGKPMQVRITPVQGCAYRFELYPGPKLEASSDGRKVLISSAMARFAERDDDLALILGHEMAHNVLEHAAHPTGSSRSRERSADYWGAYFIARAGYRVSGDLLRRFGEDDWMQNLGFLSHPAANARSRALDAAAAEIQAKRAAGRPLTPDGGANR